MNNLPHILDSYVTPEQQEISLIKHIDGTYSVFCWNAQRTDHWVTHHKTEEDGREFLEIWRPRASRAS